MKGGLHGIRVTAQRSGHAVTTQLLFRPLSHHSHCAFTCAAYDHILCLSMKSRLHGSPWLQVLLPYGGKRAYRYQALTRGFKSPSTGGPKALEMPITKTHLNELCRFFDGMRDSSSGLKPPGEVDWGLLAHAMEEAFLSSRHPTSSTSDLLLSVGAVGSLLEPLGYSDTHILKDAAKPLQNLSPQQIERMIRVNLFSASAHPMLIVGFENRITAKLPSVTWHDQSTKPPKHTYADMVSGIPIDWLVQQCILDTQQACELTHQVALRYGSYGPITYFCPTNYPTPGYQQLFVPTIGLFVAELTYDCDEGVGQIVHALKRRAMFLAELVGGRPFTLHGCVMSVEVFYCMSVSHRNGNFETAFEGCAPLNHLEAICNLHKFMESVVHRDIVHCPELLRDVFSAHNVHHLHTLISKPVGPSSDAQVTAGCSQGDNYPPVEEVVKWRFDQWQRDVQLCQISCNGSTPWIDQRFEDRHDLTQHEDDNWADDVRGPFNMKPMFSWNAKKDIRLGRGESESDIMKSYPPNREPSCE